VTACPRCEFNGLVAGACPRCGYGVTYRRPKARQRPHAATSQAAYGGLSHVRVQELYERLLDALRELGEATRDELSVRTGVPINVVTPRVRELLDAGRIVETGRTRLTRAGREAKLLALARRAEEPAMMRMLL